VIFFLPTAAFAQGWPSELAGTGFVAHADFDLSGQRQLLAEVESLQLDLQTHLQLPPLEEPFHICLFSREETYANYVSKHYPEAPRRRALFAQGDGPGLVMTHWNRELAVDLRHESTHATLHALLPVVPLWLDEGLAEYFEVSPNQRLRGNVHLSEMKWKIRLRRVPKLDHLESLTDPNRMDGDDYRDAWAWTHFMLHGPPAAREELTGYLHDLRVQRPTAPLGSRLRARLPRLERDFLDHFQHPDRWQALGAP